MGRRSITIKDGRKPPLFWVTPGVRQQDVIRQVGPDQPIVGLYSPELTVNGRPLRFEQVAAYYTETIRSLRPHGPYALAGWCAGGAFSFEIARQLQSQGETVSALILIDPLDLAISSAGLAREPFFFKAGFNLHRALYHFHQVTGRDVKSSLAYCAQAEALAAARVKRYLAHRFHKLRFDSGWRLPAKVLEIERPDDYAFRNYAPRPYAGSAVVIRPTMFKYAFDYPNRRWAQLITEGVDVREVPGDYESMWVNRGARAMAQIINSRLN